MGDKPDFMRPFGMWGGTLKFRYDSTNIASSGETTLFTINGKGQVICGLIYPAVGTSRIYDIIRIKSDGTLISFWTMSELRHFNIRDIHQAPTYLTCFKEVSHYYCVGISPFITFETSLAISVMNGHAAAVRYYTNLTYSLIE